MSQASASFGDPFGVGEKSLSFFVGHVRRSPLAVAALGEQTPPAEDDLILGPAVADIGTIAEQGVEMSCEARNYVELSRPFLGILAVFAAFDRFRCT
jgi:hypothetical protein